MTIQSVLIPKETFSLKDAIKWIMTNNYELNKIHETNNYYRFRQTIPEPNSKYVSKKLPNGIVLIATLESK